MFFNELVERDRGLRMILMVWLLLPHPRERHVCSPHTHEASHSGRPQASEPLRADWRGSGGRVLHSPYKSRSAEPLETKLSVSTAVYTATRHEALMVNSRWFVSPLSLSFSLALSWTCLSCQSSMWSPSFLIQACTHTVILSLSLSVALSFKFLCWFQRLAKRRPVFSAL